jgi:hypothetical protein
MRIRTIKPEFWTDKKVASWDHFTRLLFIGLWSAADDHGRGSAEAARLSSELFPYDLSRDPSETLARVAASLATVAESGRVTLYAADGETFYEVANWARHQRVDNAGKPKVPAPCDGTPINPRETRRESPRIAAGTGNREQGDGTGNREQEGSKVARRFQPPTREELNLEAAKIGLPDSEVDKFAHYYGANGWKVGKSPMKSWTHALAGWATRWRERVGGPNGLFPNRYGTATPADAEF